MAKVLTCAFLGRVILAGLNHEVRRESWQIKKRMTTSYLSGSES